MNTINYYFIVMVLLKFFKDDVTAAPQNYCSFIRSENFVLSIRNFDQADFKLEINMNVKQLENETVNQFLAYLQEAKNISLSSDLVIFEDNYRFSAPVSLNTPVCQVIGQTNRNRYILYVGKQLIPLQTLKERFMKGIIYDDQSGHFKLAAFSPITSKKITQIKKQIIGLDTQIIESKLDDKTFRNKISALILSGKQAKPKNIMLNSKYDARHAVASLLSKKTEILIDENKIELSQDFRDKLYAAANMQNLSNLNRTKEIINILNNYGWYVTNHFYLGGRLDVITNLQLDEASDCGIFCYIVKPIDFLFNLFLGKPEKQTDEGKLEKMEAKLATQWNNLGENIVINHKDNSKFTESEYVTSTVEGANDVQSFKNNVEHEQKWTIVSLDNIIPTCKLLFQNDAHLMGEIRRLIITDGDKPEVRNLQPNINMVQYVNDLWSDYIEPF
ncbi:uncharacterized protein LOC111519061 [Drosophila willistoni]|uniref:uncharacterized protein LOC111519061 n=1 Tax=Drosophila willistoni TaxID=7260 RepID=UPI001F0814D1|nr:uncharacterized protein LOC111519061 [Drosophila willistoni]